MRARHRHLNQRDAGATLVLDSRRISGLSDGSSVSQWNDSSRSGWNVTQGTAALRPTYKTQIQGGNPVVRFDGSEPSNADRLISSSVTLSQTFSFVSVFKVSSSDTTASVVFDSYNNTQCAFYGGYTNDNNNRFVLVAGGTNINVAKNTNFNVGCGQLSGNTSYLALNGTRTDATTFGGNGLNGISVGNLRGNTNPLDANYALNGDIALVVMVGAALPNPLRKKLEHSAAYSFKISCN